jgi:hypothetical protein
MAVKACSGRFSVRIRPPVYADVICRMRVLMKLAAGQIWKRLARTMTSGAIQVQIGRELILLLICTKIRFLPILSLSVEGPEKICSCQQCKEGDDNDKFDVDPHDVIFIPHYTYTILRAGQR